MGLEFFRQMSEKYSHINFREDSFSGSRVGPGGRADRQTDRQTG